MNSIERFVSDIAEFQEQLEEVKKIANDNRVYMKKEDGMKMAVLLASVADETSKFAVLLSKIVQEMPSIPEEQVPEDQR